MKILFVHNNYASNNSGEEHASQGLVDLLEHKGHEVFWYRKSSDIIGQSVSKKVSAFFSGIYNPTAIKELELKLEELQPDIVQIQNLYPFISPAVIKLIKKHKIPIVMRCPNYRLFCPTGLHLDGKGNVCEKCLSGVRELNCIVKNCENNNLKSLGYGIRNFAARKYWGILNNVNAYIIQTEFQKQKFISNGIPSEKLFVVPGLTPEISTNLKNTTPNMVSFIGRVSAEKGIKEFVEAASRLPEINFKVIGSYSKDYELLKAASSKNVEWTGFVGGEALDQLFIKSRIVVVPGKSYEGFPNVITRAMKHGRPVITSNIGAMASIIDHNENGLLVPPANAEALSEAIGQLFHDDEKCKLFGAAAKSKAEVLYTNDKVYQNLIEVYNYVLKPI